jgi:hypothetical protein
MTQEKSTEWAAETPKVKPMLKPAIRLRELMDAEPSTDADCLLGFRNGQALRYLCRGKAAWIIGPSGIGKSSLVTTFATDWALGRPVFGIVPSRKLKSLIVQAENDTMDLAEQVQSIASFYTREELDCLNENVLFQTETTTIGQDFCARLVELCERDKPDLVWIDPLLSYAGIDVVRQNEVTQFLRCQLQPVLEATKIVLIGIHHTGKPKSAKDMATWKPIDYAYSGIGSSELVNWARAIMVLHPHGDDLFELKLAKRGKRAGAVHPNGKWAVSEVWLEHAKDQSLSWKQIDPPVDRTACAPEDKGPAKTKPEIVAGMNLQEFLAGCKPEGEGKRAIYRRLANWLASGAPEKLVISEQGTAMRNTIELLILNGKLSYRDDLLFKGPNA